MSRTTTALRLTAALFLALLNAAPALADDVLTGREALGDCTTDAPGVRRKITVDDLASPFDTPSANNFPRMIRRPEDAWPQPPQGFKVSRVRHRPEQPAQDRHRPERRHLRRRERARPGQGAPRRRRRRQARGQSRSSPAGLSRPFGIAFYPPGPEPKLYIANTNSVVRFPYKRWRYEGARTSPRRSSPTSPASAGSAAVATGPATSSSHPTESGCSSRSARARTSTTTHGEKRRADILVFDPRRQGRADLRHGHPQPRRPGDPPEDRPDLGLGQRARRPRRSPGPRLRHPRRGRRLLRLALVLHRRPSGPAPQGEAPRAEGQGHRPRRATPVALGLALHDLLQRRPVPRSLQRRRLRRRARLVEPRTDGPATRSSASR